MKKQTFLPINILVLKCIGVMFVIYIIEVHKEYTYTVQVYLYFFGFTNFGGGNKLLAYHNIEDLYIK